MQSWAAALGGGSMSTSTRPAVSSCSTTSIASTSRARWRSLSEAEQRPGELVAAAIEQLALGTAGGGEPDRSHPLVGRVGLDGDEPLLFSERTRRLR